MSKYKEQDREIKEADEHSKKLATHLYNVGASKIEEDIYIFETPDLFRLKIERIKAEDTCPDCGSKVKYYHEDGVTRLVCKVKCQGWKVIKEIDRKHN